MQLFTQMKKIQPNNTKWYEQDRVPSHFANIFREDLSQVLTDGLVVGEPDLPVSSLLTISYEVV